jgi:uncharacterized membrane protein YeaQ/YmgE (transglycosylase-associated protein family)
MLTWIILGLIAGAIAKLIYPGKQGGGIIGTMILGIIGAFIGGTLHTLITQGRFDIVPSKGLDFLNLGLSVAGAMVAIFVWGLIFRKSD